MIINEKYILDQGTHLGFNWYVYNSGLGYRNGYICIPKDIFPWTLPNIKCHGGLTYINKETGDFWIGFDCGHKNDLIDPSLPINDIKELSFLRELTQLVELFKDDTVKSIKDNEFVKQQCINICEQLHKEAIKEKGK